MESAIRTRRINTGLSDLTHDRIVASADRPVLVVHDCTGTSRSGVAQVTGKTGDCRDDNDHTEFASFLACTNAGIDDGAADGVEYGTLVVAGGRN